MKNDMVEEISIVLYLLINASNLFVAISSDAGSTVSDEKNLDIGW